MAKNKLPVDKSPMPAKVDNDDMKYKARDALHTLKRADEIKRDKSLMKEVKRCAKDEMKALKRL